MDIQFMSNLFLYLSLLFSLCTCWRIKEVASDICYEEVFRARCPYTQEIFVVDAKYGHIALSKCIAIDFGYFGCMSDVRGIVSKRCGGKTRCEIPTPDPEIAATKTCTAGLVMYLSVSYVCLPGSISHVSCSGIKVTKWKQYVTSTQVSQARCGLDKVVFEAETNLKLKFSFTRISASENQKANGTFIAGNINKANGDHEEIELTNEETVVRETINNRVDIQLHDDTANVVLIAFQAYGCSDFEPRPHTRVLHRQGDVTVIGCEFNDHTWQLTCVDERWTGPTGNCTKLTQVMTETKPLEPKEDTAEKKVTEGVFTVEIQFALVIGITLFMCAIVVTTGYVCLKRAKYAAKPLKKENIELNGVLLEGDGTSSWTRKTVSRNKSSNQPASWQNTLSNTFISPANGTLPANTQQYLILDRDEVNT